MGRLLKPIASLLSSARRPTPGITILLYHRVGAGTSSPIDLPTELFARQIEELARDERIVSLDQAVEMLTGQPDPDAGSERPVVITFDDGTHDLVANALPVLREYNAPATLYLATSCVEERRPFWDDASPPLTWDHLDTAVASGLITVGSHTHTHMPFHDANRSQVADELDRSIELITHRLGSAPAHFAYPKALEPTPDAEVLVQARFRSAALAGTRPNIVGSTNPFRLQRSPIQTTDHMRFFRAKANGGMALEGTARKWIDHRKATQ